MREVVRGRKPLLILVGSRKNFVADLEQITSISRAALSTTKIIDRTCGEQSGKAASELAARIGRAFLRFAFPDEVHHSLKKLHKKVYDGYTKNTQFAAVLALIEEFRIACNDWGQKDRNLTVYVIVPSLYLPPVDMRPDDWTWSAESVSGIQRGTRAQDLSLERISHLIMENAATGNDSALVELWALWGEALRSGCLNYSDSEVSSIQLEVLSTSELSYEAYTASEPLDFSALSLTSGA